MDDSLLQDAIQTHAAADCLISKNKIDQTIDNLAKDMQQVIGADVPVFLCVMKGGLMFTSELMKRIQSPLELDYVHVDRYRNQTAGSDIQWHKEPNINLNNRLVIILDDIFDQGHTLKALLKYCNDKGAKKIFSAVLLRKKLSEQDVELIPDFIGLEVVDRYVYGCGMDYKGYWRNLTEVYAVAQD